MEIPDLTDLPGWNVIPSGFVTLKQISLDYGVCPEDVDVIFFTDRKIPRMQFSALSTCMNLASSLSPDTW